MHFLSDTTRAKGYAPCHNPDTVNVNIHPNTCIGDGLTKGKFIDYERDLRSWRLQLVLSRKDFKRCERKISKIYSIFVVPFWGSRENNIRN